MMRTKLLNLLMFASLSVTIVIFRTAVLKNQVSGIPGWLIGLAPAFGPGRDPGVPDRVPRQAPGMEPASPSSCVSASLSFSLYVYHK